MKLKLKLDNQHTREVWQAVQQAKDEVAGWPAWKRGEANATTRISPRTADVVPAGVPDNPAAIACGIPRDEGVLVAYIPKLVEGGPMTYLEHAYRDGKRSFVVYSYDGVVLDMMPTDSKGVKWWMVREAARSLGLDYPEPILTCAAEDFSVRCLPDVPAQPDCDLAFRAYGRGPWIKLTDFEVKNGRESADGHSAPAEPTGPAPVCVP